MGMFDGTSLLAVWFCSASYAAYAAFTGLFSLRRLYTAAADYIALYNGDKKTLAESLSVIQETSTRILDELMPEERRAKSDRFERIEPTRVASPAHTPEEPVSPDR